MPGLVLDGSVTIAWALRDEARADEARALVHRVAANSAIVPAIWKLEVGNALFMAERRKRISPARVDAVHRYLSALPIAIDTETNVRAWGAIKALARRHKLTLYDAAYLELGIRLSLPLASFDGALSRAASAEKVLIV